MNAFVKDTAERVVRTFAQTALALLGANALNITDIDYAEVGGVAAGAALLTLLTCIAGGKWGGDLGPAAILNAPKVKE